MLSSIKVVDKHAADEAFRREQKALKKQKKKRKKVINLALPSFACIPEVLSRPADPLPIHATGEEGQQTRGRPATTPAGCVSLAIQERRGRATATLVTTCSAVHSSSGDTTGLTPAGRSGGSSGDDSDEPQTGGDDGAQAAGSAPPAEAREDWMTKPMARSVVTPPEEADDEPAQPKTTVCSLSGQRTPCGSGRCRKLPCELGQCCF